MSHVSDQLKCLLPMALGPVGKPTIPTIIITLASRYVYYTYYLYILEYIGRYITTRLGI